MMTLFEPSEPDNRSPLHSKTFERDRRGFLSGSCSGSRRCYFAEFFWVTRGSGKAAGGLRSPPNTLPFRLTKCTPAQAWQVIPFNRPWTYPHRRPTCAGPPSE